MQMKINLSKTGLYFAALVISLMALPQAVNAATSISQFGITWTFDKDYTTGQFANGDYWVVGPVTITSITPACTTSGGKVINGSQVNPDPKVTRQGYDSINTENPYDASLNKALNMPLTLQPGTSLVSSITLSSMQYTSVKGMAVLTVLASAPPAGSFRPPYCGTDKTIKFNKSQLDYSKLAKLQPVSSTPRLKQQPGDAQNASVERMFERPWIDHIPWWTGRSVHPADNMPDYGREMVEEVGIASLMLNLNFTDAEKETLLIRFVQLGIDNYGVIKAGGKDNWAADGGHASGRLWPILFAGIVLNDAEMKNVRSTGAHFGEIDQTFYVSQADIDLKGHHDSTGATQVDYQQSDLGLPEWGIVHAFEPINDDRNWGLTTKSGYRLCCTAVAWAGQILASHIMGAKDLWNHPALFDYQDRYMSIEREYRCWSQFSCDMWDRYRADYGCIWTRTNPNDTYSNGTNSCNSNPDPNKKPPSANAGPNQSVTDTDNNGSQSVTLDGSGSTDSDGTITSYVWKEGSTQIATGIKPTVSLAVGVHTITLTVTDNDGLTATDTVVITVNAPPANQAPTANAGPDQTVTDSDNNGSQSVILNGSGSYDSDGSITSYVWKKGSTQLATGITPTVTLAVGTHIITLTVTDNGGLTATDTVVITVNAPAINQTPSANAGPDQTVTDSDDNGNQAVILTGSGSSDSDGSIISYVWTEGSTQLATGITPTITLTVGTHIITLTVTDNGGLTASDTVVIQVLAPGDTTPPSVLSVTATGTTVEIVFNEALNQASASNIKNYSINQGLTINSVTFDSANNKVTLNTATQSDGTVYTLSIANIADTAGNIMSPTTRNFSYTQGLAGYWKFNDGQGLTAADSSGNSNTATLVNGPAWTSQGEIAFDGNNDAVAVGTAKMSAAQGTIAMWIYPDSFPKSRNYIFGHAAYLWRNRIQLYCSQSGTLGLGLGSNTNLNTDIQTLNARQWYHVILTWDGSNYAVYIDGVQKANGSYSGLTALNSSADIGNNGNSSTRNEAFDGLIDEVMIFNRVLTSPEIARLALSFLPIDDKIITEGQELNFTVRTKPGVIVDLSDNNLPRQPYFTSNIFRWTPGYNDAGNYQLEFTAPHGSSSDFEKINITVTNAVPPAENIPGLIGMWAFDETAGETANDSSANGNTGYLINGLDWSTGTIEGAVEFSIPNDYVEISTAKLNPTEGTIAMWFYVNRLTLARHYLFGAASSDLNSRIQLYLKYGNLCVGLGNSSETAMNIQRLENQQWYHVMLCWKQNTYKVFVDGVLKTSGVFSGLSSFGPTADIGNNGIYHDKALNGRIDEVRIYNYALNDAEISALTQ